MVHVLIDMLIGVLIDKNEFMLTTAAQHNVPRLSKGQIDPLWKIISHAKEKGNGRTTTTKAGH